ncbi:hypothetical protein B0H10DRAFT_2197160 [Mycena sp. CBHHK59/15]|nr:hypothetical protein B0H10DRAFT_2197160 [Mycena sp. CBHHK59/15]
MTRAAVPSAHALRNASRPIQLSRKHASVPTAVKRTKAAAALQKKMDTVNFEAALDAHYEHRDSEITRMALEFHVKREKVQRLICNVSRIKATRAPTLRNAFLHDVAVKAKLAGQSRKLLEIQSSVEFDPDHISKAEKLRLIAQLVAYRAIRKRGIRATNKAAAMDAQQAATKIGELLVDLFERTGVRGFAIMSRGHPDDAALPHRVDSDGVLQSFFAQQYKRSALDVLRLFESHSCAMDDGGKEKLDVASMRKVVIEWQHDAFQRIAKDKKAKISYENYDYEVRELRGCEIVGWPKGGAAVSESSGRDSTAAQAHESGGGGGARAQPASLLW